MRRHFQFRGRVSDSIREQAHPAVLAVHVELPKDEIRGI
jgi:hypothetical protein